MAHGTAQVDAHSHTSLRASILGRTGAEVLGEVLAEVLVEKSSSWSWGLTLGALAPATAGGVLHTGHDLGQRLL